MFRRRTHRVSRGVKLIKAGTMTYESSQAPAPLSALEEAMLIAATRAHRPYDARPAVPGPHYRQGDHG
jgi:hypothetical protein